MILGMPNNPRRPPEQEITWAADHGFDFLDLSLEPDVCLPDRVDPAAIRAALRARGLGVVGHTAWFLPIGSPLPGLRRAAVEAVAAALEAFGRIGAPRATVHTHWPSHLFTPAEGIAFQAESLGRLLPVARNAGVRLMLEPAASWLDVPDHVQALLDAFPDLECHLDLGHCNLNGFRTPDWIRRFAGRLTHVHAHDNNGREDQHLPPGTGSVDWPQTLRALRDVRYDATITIECFSQDRAYLLLARDRIRAMWEGAA